MTEDDIRSALRKRAGKRGIAMWCVFYGIPQSHVSEFLSGKKSVPSKVLDALGLEISYRRKKSLAANNKMADNVRRGD